MNLYITQQTPGNACAVLQSMGACGTRFQHCHARTRHYNLPWMPTAVGASGPAAPQKDQPALHAVTDEEGRPHDDAGGSREMLCSCWLALRPKKAIMCVLVTHTIRNFVERAPDALERTPCKEFDEMLATPSTAPSDGQNLVSVHLLGALVARFSWVFTRKPFYPQVSSWDIHGSRLLISSCFVGH